ncbi:MAG: hypothetical protein VYA30_09540 [Myxococcota bacterium]|nr:hypothetical protein [Myxococcota bacterium]
MGWALWLILAASPPCSVGDVFHVDGDVVTDYDVSKLARLEELTGLKHTEATAALTALERRAKVALLRRTGLRATQTEIHQAFEDHLRAAGKPDVIRRAFQVVGKEAYLRLYVEPDFAERKLTRYYDNEVATAGRSRAAATLRVLLSGRKTIEAIRGQPSQGLIYGRFRLTPNELIHHFSPGQRDDYLERLEAYHTGRSDIRPATPQSPVENVDGLGLGNVGYVRQMADVLDKIDDGDWSRQVVRDQHQWLIMRRISENGGVYEGECFRFPIIQFHDWLVSRYRELDFKLCSTQIAEKARRTAASNPFVELFR